MGERHLRNLLSTLSSSRELDAWYARHATKAYVGLVHEAQKRNNPSLLDPDARHEVVTQTVINILESREAYTWDGQGSFEKFFNDCLKRTIWWMHSRTRADRQKILTTDDLEALAEAFATKPTQDGWLGQAIHPKAVERSIAGTKVNDGSSLHKYMSRLPVYVLEGYEPSEISEDLNVDVKSLSTLRVRARTYFDDPEKD